VKGRKELEREKLGGIYQVLVKNNAEAMMLNFNIAKPSEPV
jgi:hypothetical protein